MVARVCSMRKLLRRTAASPLLPRMQVLRTNPESAPSEVTHRVRLLALAIFVMAAVLAGAAGFSIYTWGYRNDSRTEARWDAQMWVSYCNVFDKHRCVNAQGAATEGEADVSASRPRDARAHG
jgi:hypothetical protein